MNNEVSQWLKNGRCQDLFYNGIIDLCGIV